MLSLVLYGNKQLYELLNFKSENKSIAHKKAAIALYALAVALILVASSWILLDQRPISRF